MTIVPTNKQYMVSRYSYNKRLPQANIELANTLRMLFQAQKEPIVSPPSDEHSPSAEPPSEPEALDPRQQTLLKFFRLTPSSSSKFDAHHNYSISEVSAFDAQPAQSHRTEIEYDHASSTSGSSTPYSTGVMDVDMNMDENPNTKYTPGKIWTGSISWI